MLYAPPEYSRPGNSEKYDPVVAAPRFAESLFLSCNMTPWLAAPPLKFLLLLNS
jgi:hypothetical protein